MAHGVPAAGLAAGLSDHPAGRLDDHAALFQHRDELSGRYQSALRRIPAQQRFHDFGLALGVDLGLVMQHELVPVSARRRGLLEGAAAGGGIAERLVVEHRAVAAGILGRIQGESTCLSRSLALCRPSLMATPMLGLT